jgi:aminoglycoside phosphotransferase (APT) family kinase protein
MSARMHADEVDIDLGLVRRLIAAQFPAWSNLAIEPVHSIGTVNALYRMGPGMVVRLPRTDWAQGAFERQARWLPIIAGSVPLEVPVAMRKGEPAFGYPYEWGVYSWLPGEPVTAGAEPGEAEIARSLAGLLAGLQLVDPTGAPAQRRGELRDGWDRPVREALGALGDDIDTKAAEAAWDEALTTAAWKGPARWVHGDLMAANLLVAEGRLSGVIDWEAAGVGDPAVDLQVAWNTLSATGRSVLRTALDVDDATWARGKGWALCTGLVALPYYRQTNPELAANARFRIRQVLAG